MIDLRTFIFEYVRNKTAKNGQKKSKTTSPESSHHTHTHTARCVVVLLYALFGE